MQAPLDSPSPRDMLLRCIGRNVVNFQYLEATLRSMLPSLANEGTLQELHANLAATTRRNKKSSLGSLADSFLDGVFGKEKSTDHEAAEPATEIRIRMSIQIECTPEDSAAQRKALLKLVAERNRLVHRSALEIDLNSPEACNRMIDLLDEQNARIRSQLDYLNSLRHAHRESLEELLRFVNSGEFLRVLQGHSDA